MLGLRCCLGFFSSCGVRASRCRGVPCCRVWALGAGASVVVTREPMAVALELGFSSCDICLVAWSTWGLPRPGMELMSLALQGGFLATRPPGKPSNTHVDVIEKHCGLCDLGPWVRDPSSINGILEDICKFLFCVLSLMPILSHRYDLTPYGRPPVVCNLIASCHSLLWSSSFVCVAI